MSTGKVVLGALAGVAAGAILGVLFAPEKGTETRKKIAEKGKDAAGDLKTKYNDLIDKLTSKLETVKDEGLGYLENEKNNLVKTAKSSYESSSK
ncbi:YtxH domain-containing protein [Flavobacterium sp. GT3R68]|uniref:YtxH domain-containing protein n=1 Tax=Flavobacterium sp. GT3R68 TaxID=2594437 RepID=UPI000F889E37|nr:YtxH domain-containing protein [Flavobacterium sp. GT3R68]RTY95032.1 YtxH domain-containing protein [Flavobacterium sp. GSN2]TRW91838.1 YtxH domain-containing protein [Flavobacterium sp. GT3R68]